jgi:hypothetical protein
MANRIFQAGKTKYSQPIIPFQQIADVPEPLLDHLISFLRGVDVRHVSLELLITNFEKLLRLYSITFLSGPYYPYYYRARPVSARNVSELLNPPSNFIKQYGRCNKVEESLFYCSNCYTTSILEVKPQKGDIVTVLAVEVTLNRNINNFLPLFSFGGAKTREELLQNFVHSGDERIQKKLDKIEQAFNEIFVQEVGPGEEWKYKKSVALTQAAFRIYPKQPIGVAYPSKASRLYGLNFAIHPKCFERLEPKAFKAFKLEITNKRNDFDLEAKFIEVAKEIDSAGNFVFHQVSSEDSIIGLNSRFYEDYEEVFNKQREALPKNSFFRRYYQFPFADNR